MRFGRRIRRALRRRARGRSSSGSRKSTVPPSRIAEFLWNYSEERGRLDQVRVGTPADEQDSRAPAPEHDLERITDAPIAKLVEALSEDVDARLESFARRLAAIEQQVQDQSARRPREGKGTRLWSRERRELATEPDEAAADPRRAVDDGLRALSAGQPERGPGGE